MGIGNIHVMRNSHRKILGSCETGNWRTAVQKSSWLTHVQRVLASACRVAAKVAANQSVLVHCSDGEFGFAYAVTIPSVPSFTLPSSF